jgi:hypothetical protein
MTIHTVEHTEEITPFILTEEVLRLAASELCRRAAVIGSSRMTKQQRIDRARGAGLARVRKAAMAAAVAKAKVKAEAKAVKAVKVTVYTPSRAV